MLKYRSYLLLLLTVWGCGDDPVSPSPGAVFEVEVARQETFRIALDDPALIATAEQRLDDKTEGIVHGTLARGDGGFNAPYTWHLKPETITFPDQAIEVCSGRPMSDVESDLAYWVDTIGIYCPWGARLIRRIR
jgi:hypothetical protein